MPSSQNRTYPVSLERVPVFPLPRLVLFPGTRLPLHLFEPRYVAMARDCVRSPEPLLAVVQLQPGFEADYHGRPPIHEYGGVGRVEAFRENPDGTFDVVLDAFSRVRVREHDRCELPYRTGDLTCVRDVLPAMGLRRREVSALLTLAQRITAVLQQAEPDFDLSVDPEAEPGEMADVIADQLVLDPSARQSLLECLDVGERIRLVVDHLARLHMALGAADSPEPTVH